MDLDLTQIEGQLLQALGIVLMSMATVAARKIIQRLNLKFSNEQKGEMEDVAWKSVSWGIGQATELIARKGWDHADAKSASVGMAIEYAIHRFPDAMERAGVDTKDPKAATQKLAGIMDRIFPEVAKHLSESPATPPVIEVVPTNPVLIASTAVDR